MIKKLIFSFLIITSGLFSQQVSKLDWKSYYSGYDGVFSVYDQNRDEYLISDSIMFQTRFAPASTFKILNGMIGLECGIITDENYVIPWDSVESSVKEWNHDHTFASAIKYSVVPYFRELARRIGAEQMQKYLNMVDYGNKDITDGLDKFWLTGSLKISPQEQLEFIKKLYYKSLPLSVRSMDIMKNMILLDKNEDFTLYGKTGFTTVNDTSVAWLVGFVEKNKNVYFYVSALAGSSYQKIFDDRKTVPLKILTDLGLLKDK